MGLRDLFRRNDDGEDLTAELIRENEEQRGPADATPGWSGGAPDALSTSPDLTEVRALVAQGKMIQAIKEYRELTGLGLAESKDAVDAIAAGRVPAAPPAAALCSDDAILHILDGNLIAAIKAQREATGQGLAQAKAAVDAEVAAMRSRGELA